MIYEEPLFLPAGDSAVVVELGDAIDPRVNRRVHNLADAIDAAAASGDIHGIVDFLPTYRSALIQYDPLIIGADELEARVRRLVRGRSAAPDGDARAVSIPTLYGGEYGPDIGFVAERAGMSEEDVVAVHSGAEYLVYMMGFSPGFAYLGGLDPRLTTPRLTTPRMEIPAGAVGIAEAQTGVYPMASPGGWQLIGRTPLRLFDAGRQPPALLKAGDFVRFAPLASQSEYDEMRRQADAGEYDAAAGEALR